MKIRPVGVTSFHTSDGRTDRQDTAELIVAFRNFANSPPKNGTHFVSSTVFA